VHARHGRQIHQQLKIQLTEHLVDILKRVLNAIGLSVPLNSLNQRIADGYQFHCRTLL